MSLPSMFPSPAAALPPANFHPHNHRRTSSLDPNNDASSGTTAQVPVAAAQNLFGTLLKSLEAVVGLQLGTTPGTTAAGAAAANSAAASGSSIPSAAATGPAASAGSTASAAAPSPQSAGTLLQNYLNNLSQLQAEGVQPAKYAGSGVSTKV